MQAHSNLIRNFLVQAHNNANPNDQAVIDAALVFLPQQPAEILGWAFFNNLRQSDQEEPGHAVAETLAMRNDACAALAPLQHLRCPYCSGFGHKASKCETGNKIKNFAMQNERIRAMFAAALAPLEDAQRQRSLNNRHARIMCVPVGTIVRRAIRKKNVRAQAVAVEGGSDSEMEFDSTEEM